MSKSIFESYRSWSLQNSSPKDPSIISRKYCKYDSFKLKLSMGNVIYPIDFHKKSCFVHLKSMSTKLEHHRVLLKDQEVGNTLESLLYKAH